MNLITIRILVEVFCSLIQLISRSFSSRDLPLLLHSEAWAIYNQWQRKKKILPILITTWNFLATQVKSTIIFKKTSNGPESTRRPDSWFKSSALFSLRAKSNSWGSKINSCFSLYMATLQSAQPWRAASNSNCFSPSRINSDLTLIIIKSYGRKSISAELGASRLGAATEKFADFPRGPRFQDRR
jgi:hypothetical protein